MVGRLEVTKHQVSVGPDGVINVPPIGGIDIRGLTLGQANQRIAERVRSMFRFVETTIAVAMPRCLEIVLSGDIERPGTMLTPATRRLQDVILAAGGVAPRGSARHIRLTTGQQEREVDLLRFELTGDLSQNPLVEDGLRVHVPPRGVAITLSGAVRRPGEYEIDDAGSLRDLLGLVGGLHPTAARRDARLTRLGPDGRKQTLSVDLQTALVAPSDVRLQSGDVLFVPTVAQLNDIVEVRGAFAGSPESGRTTTGGKPTIVQRFELATGDRVRDLVTRAGGPAPFADLRLGVVERRATTGPLQRVPVDLHRLLVEKDEAQNIELHNGDVLVLPIIEDKVYVLGEVKQPGAQDFRQDLTIREYLALAGGPGNRAKIKNTTVTFRDGKTYAMESTPPLEPGAVVTVPEVSVKWWQDYVQIAGVIAGLITAYTGIFILFGGNTYSRSDR